MSMQPPSPLAPGLTLDRYELICPIAQGGMASVWIARQTGKHGFERLVAIKTILPKYAADASFQTMFLDETRITSRIEHNNVVRVLDVGEQHGTTYLVMEYVDGDALSTIHRTLKKRPIPIPPGVLLRIMADVCGGLHAAHELRGESEEILGVVHRDVSPHNILVSANGDAKLIDFGIAKARDRLAGDTNTGTVKGKVRYMAPEQALGAPADRRVDIWAIGAVLYDLLSGRPPFLCETDVQTLLALTSGLPPVPLPSSVPRPIADLVRRALETKAANRFATAAEMQQAIEDAMVAAKIATGTAAVAAFLAEHVGERAQARKNAILLGLKAAAEREKYASLMRTSVRSMASATPQRTRVDGRGLDAPPLAAGPERHSAITSGTLGSAAIGIPHRRSHRTWVTVALSATLFGAAALTSIAVRSSIAKPAAVEIRSESTLVAAAPAARTEREVPISAELTTPSVVASGARDSAPPTSAPSSSPALSARPSPPAQPSRPTSAQASSARGRAPKPRIDDGF